MKTTEAFHSPTMERGKIHPLREREENVSIGQQSVRETRLPALTGENINVEHNRYGENTYVDHELAGETHTHRLEHEGSFTGIHG